MDTSQRATLQRPEIVKPLRTWAGHGTGATCNGCGGLFQANDIEYEMEQPAGSDSASLHFHFKCYRSWTGRGVR